MAVSEDYMGQLIKKTSEKLRGRIDATKEALAGVGREKISTEKQMEIYEGLKEEDFVALEQRMGREKVAEYISEMVKRQRRRANA